MTIQELTCFYTVAQTLNYTKAAEKLYISQPVVSRHIALLEQELGLLLIDRNVRRAIKLTRAGEEFFACLKRCDRDFSDTVENLQIQATTSQIVFCIPEDCMFPLRLHQKFETFSRRYLRNRLELKYVSYDRFSEELDNGNFVICQKDALLTKRNYDRKEIDAECVPYYLIMSAQHLAFHGREHCDLKDFAGYPLFLTKTMPPKLVKYYVDCVAGAVGREPEIKLLDNADMVVLYLQSHTGLTVGTGWFKYLGTASLRAVPLNVSTRYAIYWNPEKPLNSAARQFADTL